ncbi:MAG: YbaB/EbfC family nucleoid-associated protein [Mycobacteriaceae bacterium]|nr:YbaB/EbfC family nucleoid-associated protein [Mycobacteriaceae bacterium]
MERTWLGSRREPLPLDSQLLAAFAEFQQQAADMRSRLEATRVAATSSDGLVEATVDAAGALAEIRFAPTAQRCTGTQLANAITEAAKAARAQARSDCDAAVGPVTETANQLMGMLGIDPPWLAGQGNGV